VTPLPPSIASNSHALVALGPPTHSVTFARFPRLFPQEEALRRELSEVRAQWRRELAEAARNTTDLQLRWAGGCHGRPAHGK
jgi:hypothetical protein